jgi:hypothetical protein
MNSAKNCALRVGLCFAAKISYFKGKFTLWLLISPPIRSGGEL